jgi:hypothetical protein
MDGRARDASRGDAVIPIAHLAFVAAAALRMIRDGFACGLPRWVLAGLRQHAHDVVAGLWRPLRDAERPDDAGWDPASPGGAVGGRAWLTWKIAAGLREDPIGPPLVVPLDGPELDDAIEWVEWLARDLKAGAAEATSDVLERTAQQSGSA